MAVSVVNPITGAPLALQTAPGAVTTVARPGFLAQCKTTAGAVTVNCPVSPVDGAAFAVQDVDGSAATNNITIAGGAKLIDGAASLVLSNASAVATLLFDSADDQWHRVLVLRTEEGAPLPYVRTADIPDQVSASGAAGTVQISNGSGGFSGATNVLGGSGFISIGTPPATAGSIRVATAFSLQARRSDNAANVSAMVMAGDALYLGTSAAFGEQVTSSNYYAVSAQAFGLGATTYFYLSGGNVESWVPRTGSSTGSSPYGIDGTGVQAMADANQTLSASIYRYGTLRFTGANTAVRDATIPDGTTAGSYLKLIDNQCTGSGVRIKTSAGVTVTVLNSRAVVVADASGVNAYSFPELAGTVYLAGQEYVSSVDTKGTLHDVQPKRVQTADATVTTLDSWPIPTGTFIVSVVVSATKDDNSQGAAYVRTAAFRNAAGTVAQIGATQDGGTFEDDATWDCTIDNSTTTGRVRVTGKAGTSITWTCVSSRLEVIP